METTRPGDYNPGEDGKEIEFEDSFFTNVLNMNSANEKGGTDLEFMYNNAVTLTAKENTYTLNGITFQFNDTTAFEDDVPITSAKLTVTSDTAASC